jgi:hypothetical protein
MKRAYIIVFMISMSALSYGQSGWYSTSGSETIFSFPIFKDQNQETTVVRFAPVLNVQYLMNKDLGKSFGIFTGLALRNVGFIADDPADGNIRKKFRTYNLAVPVGIKLGNMNKLMLYGGVDFEYAFNYKEKTFVDDSKSKDVAWFSNRHRQFMPAVHAGFQFATGLNIKFKYYLNSFFNPDRSDYAANYERFDANVFYVSLNSNLFKGTKFTYSSSE